LTKKELKKIEEELYKKRYAEEMEKFKT